MTDITIPPAALEAGAKALCAKAGYAWTVTPDVHAHWREQARAAFLAMLENWPGIAWQQGGNGTERPLLPLPAEASDDR